MIIDDIEFDKDFLVHAEISELEDTNSLDQHSRFFAELIKTIYDIYFTLLHNLFDVSIYHLSTHIYIYISIGLFPNLYIYIPLFLFFSEIR